MPVSLLQQSECDFGRRVLFPRIEGSASGQGNLDWKQDLDCGVAGTIDAPRDLAGLLSDAKRMNQPAALAEVSRLTRSLSRSELRIDSDVGPHDRCEFRAHTDRASFPRCRSSVRDTVVESVRECNQNRCTRGRRRHRIVCQKLLRSSIRDIEHTREQNNFTRYSVYVGVASAPPRFAVFWSAWRKQSCVVDECVDDRQEENRTMNFADSGLSIMSPYEQIPMP